MSRFLISILAVATMVPAATSAMAEEVAPAHAAEAAAVAPKVGQTVRDADGRRLGQIDSIQNGSANVIMDMRMLRIPLNTLTANGKGLQTSLTRSALN